MALIKKYDIITLPSFEDDLNKIYHYLSNILKEPDIANIFHSKVIKEINSLKFFPERYMRVFNKKEKNIRRVLIDRYVIIYEIKRNTRSNFYFTYFSL